LKIQLHVDPTARRIIIAVAVPFVLLGLGTLGYVEIEGWPLFDAMYMTVTTLATVGFGEVHPLTNHGRIFTVALILGGVFTMAAAVTSVIRAVVSGEVQRLLGRQRMERSLAGMKDHVIVCGYGRMGRIVCEELATIGQPFVAVDRDHALIEHFPSRVGVALEGDATADEVLKKAGIERARAVVTALPHDADNLFITMSARILNEKVFVVARAEDPASETKLTRAGANRVVAPYVLGGGRVVQAVLRPTVLDFIDLATKTHHIELQMEETLVGDGSSLVGKKLSESMTREHRIIVVAIKRNGGRMEFNPGGETRLESGDTLISLGHRHDLDRLEEWARAAARAS
jgi:voltage-gated potassium channel